MKIQTLEGRFCYQWSGEKGELYGSIANADPGLFYPEKSIYDKGNSNLKAGAIPGVIYELIME